MHVKRSGKIRKRLIATVATTLPLLAGVGTAAATQVGGAGTSAAPSAAASPTVTGPVTGGNGAVVLQGTSFDLGSVGYTQSEFFLSGDAASYVPQTPLDSDGNWQVAPVGTAPYTTRVVVNRPADPARFNGTVVVEWLNVTAGLDTAPEWIYTHDELIREGYAWVGVSAQSVGASATEAADPVRYAALSHPGDSYSYDVYSQAGQAVRDSGATILDGLSPRTVLAIGESQSAFRLTTYANAVHPLVSVYDGFLIHSRGGDSAPLSQAPQADAPAPRVVRLRQDLDAPVLTVQTESDVAGQLNSVSARQADTNRLRLWEVAGTAHADAYLVSGGHAGSTDPGLAGINAMLNPPTRLGCSTPINTGQAHYVLKAAVTALNRWVTVGLAPATAPRLHVDTTGATPALVLDAHGNARGGIRTPSVQAPVATLSGLGQTGAAFCFLFGTTEPFGTEKLATLYPTHGIFVAKWSAATTDAVTRGYVRPVDGIELAGAAARSDVGN